MMGQFEEILARLSQELGISLHVDAHQVCLLNIRQTLKVYLEFDTSKGRLLFASFLCPLLSGTFRERVLEIALKANGIFPFSRIFGFSERTNELVLFCYLYSSQFDGPSLLFNLQSFVEEAEMWREPILRGEIPVISVKEETTLPSPLSLSSGRKDVSKS
jgi:hypothetical protein